MSYARFGRGVTRPPSGAQIDWAHPLATGLEFDFSFSEGSGLASFDRTRQFRGVHQNSPVWAARGLDLSGSAFVETSGPEPIMDTSFSDTPYLGSITIVWRGVIRTGGAFRHFAGKHAGNGGSANPFDFRTNDAGTPSLVLVRANGGATTYNGPQVSLNTMSTLSVTAPIQAGSAVKFYVNGAMTSAVNPSIVPTGSNANLRIGRRTDGAVQMDGVVEFCRGYSRALSQDEIAWIVAEPYGHLISGSIRRYFVVQAATSLDSWYQPLAIPPAQISRTQHLYPPGADDPAALTTPAEQVNLDKWHQEQNRPPADVARWQYLFPTQAIDPTAYLIPPPTITMDMWAQLIATPRFDQPRNNFLYPSVANDPDALLSGSPAATGNIVQYPNYDPLPHWGVQKRRPYLDVLQYDPLPQITIQPTPIASTFNSGVHTFLLEPNAAVVGGSLITVFINGVDRTGFVRVDPGVNFEYQISAAGRANFVCYTKPGSFRPAVDHEVVIYKGTNRIFAGHIESTEEEYYNGTNAMNVAVTCSDYSIMLERRIVSRWFDTSIIYDAFGMIREILRTDLAATGIRPNTVIATSLVNDEQDYVVQHLPMTEVVRMLLEPDNLDWRVDPWKTLQIFPKSTGYTSAPTGFADNDDKFETMRVARSRSRRANRVGVRNDQRQPELWVDSFVGDGVVQYFITTYVLNTTPIVTVNGVLATVIPYNAYSLAPHDFSYVPGGYGVFSNPYAAPYTSSDTILVSYPSKLQPIIWAEDAASIAADGLWEIVEDIRDYGFDLDRQLEIAQGLVEKLKNPPYIVDVQTRVDGFEPGQLININTTQPLVPNLNLLIESVSGQEVDKAFMRYRLRAISTQSLMSHHNFLKTIRRIRELTEQPQDRITYKVIFKLAKTVEGLTNPGLQTGKYTDERIAEKSGIIKDAQLRFVTPPTANDVEFDIFINGITTSILGTTKYTFRTTDAGSTVPRYQFATHPYFVEKGDVFRAFVVTGDTTAMDGTLELTIAG